MSSSKTLTTRVDVFHSSRVEHNHIAWSSECSKHSLVIRFHQGKVAQGEVEQYHILRLRWRVF
jgi:hypothetical protein